MFPRISCLSSKLLESWKPCWVFVHLALLCVGKVHSQPAIYLLKRSGLSSFFQLFFSALTLPSRYFVSRQTFLLYWERAPTKHRKTLSHCRVVVLGLAVVYRLCQLLYFVQTSLLVKPEALAKSDQSLDTKCAAEPMTSWVIAKFSDCLTLIRSEQKALRQSWVWEFVCFKFCICLLCSNLKRTCNLRSY